MAPDPAYALLDIGDGRRLERFGPRVVERPLPPDGARPGHDPRHGRDAGGRRGAGPWSGPGEGPTADLRFERDRGWSGPALAAGPWPIELDGLVMELRPTESGQVGLFPEQRAMLPWLADRAVTSAGTSAATSVLNLFAYTGLVSLGLAGRGVAVTHVDASRPTVAWARHNASLAGLGAAPIRWIVDDAGAFVAREARRGRRYGGLVLDPPSYGHAGHGRAWTIDLLPDLLAVCHTVLDEDGFVLLTAHSPGFDADRLVGALADGLHRPLATIEAGELGLSTADGRRLPLGAFARSAGGA